MTLPRRTLLSLLPMAAPWLALAGCASPPPTRFYTLALPRPAVGGAPPWPLLVLATVRLPDLIDRPQRVRRLSPTRVQIDEFALWAQPLREEIGAAIAADLGARWPTLVVDRRAEASAAAPRLALTVERFESDDAGAVAVLQWTLQQPGRGPAAGQVRGLARQAGTGDDATLHALSQALADACEQLATALHHAGSATANNSRSAPAPHQ